MKKSWRNNLRSALILIFLMNANQAMADSWSLGVLAGKAEFDNIGSRCFSSIRPSIPETCSDDVDDRALGINLAYNINQAFGLEAGYVDAGSSSVTFSFQGTFEDSAISLSARYLAGTASYALSDKWSITGRLGYYDATIDINFINNLFSTSSSERVNDVYSGASINYEFIDNWSAQLRYDRFDIDVVSFGLSYSFGN